MARSLLEPTGNEAAERAVIAERERPGSWFGDAGADGRVLTQDQTEALIRAELVRIAPRSERDEVLRAVGGAPGLVRFVPDARNRRALRASFQRGGIDSDPLVRLLAFRAWGDRDVRWFDERGIRKGEPVALIPGGHALAGWGFPQTELALAAGREVVAGIAARDAAPGTQVDLLLETAAAAIPPGDVYIRDGQRWATLTVSARPRAPRERDDGLPTRRDLLCVAYGFDRLDVEPDPQGGRRTVVTAERGSYQASERIDVNDLTAEAEARVWSRCCSLLGRELHRMGSGRAAPPA